MVRCYYNWYWNVEEHNESLCEVIRAIKQTLYSCKRYFSRALISWKENLIGFTHNEYLFETVEDQY